MLIIFKVNKANLLTAFSFYANQAEYKIYIEVNLVFWMSFCLF